MSTNKTTNRKVLQRTAKKVGLGNEKSKKEVGLKDQYSIIREDLLKLRDDIAKGYDMTKEWIDKNGTVRGLLIKAK